MTDLVIQVQGRAGRITLNRPKTLNALPHAMILQIDAALRVWADDPEIAIVVIDGSGPKAFCAGGDLLALYTAAKRGDLQSCCDFWRDEYRLNAQIAGYRKPVVSLLHGLVMGGGVGLGCHASCRIVDETAQIALPECRIGLVPDAGTSLILAAAPGFLGEYLGLTGTAMNAADAIYAGFADSFVPKDGWPEMLKNLCATGLIDAVQIAQLGPGPSSLAGLLPALDALFGTAKTARLQNDPLFERAFAASSPLSICATLRLLQLARQFDRIEQALEAEFRFTSRAFANGDFAEGIRALLIDKDNTPHWRHKGVAAVSDADLDAVFAQLTHGVFPKIITNLGVAS